MGGQRTLREWIEDPWDYPLRGELRGRQKEIPCSESGRMGTKGRCQTFFVNDLEHPYVETKRFDWIRGYQVGGRSLTWGRQSYRWSDIDFEAKKKEGIDIDWPVRYKDISPRPSNSKQANFLEKKPTILTDYQTLTVHGQRFSEKYVGRLSGSAS